MSSTGKHTSPHNWLAIPTIAVNLPEVLCVDLQIMRHIPSPFDHKIHDQTRVKIIQCHPTPKSDIRVPFR